MKTPVKIVYRWIEYYDIEQQVIKEKQEVEQSNAKP